MSGGTSSSSTTQAPTWQQPYQSYGLNQALGQYQNVTNPSQLVAPFSPQQTQAIGNITNLAQSGDPSVNAAENYTANTLNGNVQTNPMLNQLFQQGASQIQQQMDSQFAGAGRNVDQDQGQTAQALGNFGANLYGNAYNTEQGAQNAALYAAPSMLNSQLGLQSALYGAGQNVQNLGQQYIQAPQTFLNQYLSQVNGNLGATQSTPYNSTTGAIGGGLLGSSLGNALGGYLNGSGSSGLGSLLGGGLGALAGYL
jgi:hypothetical protein